MSDSRQLLSLVLAICKGIVRDQRVRRAVLFFVMLAAMGLLFAGIVVIDRWLMRHPLLFLVYWGACLWLTLLSILMALYDLLKLRQTARDERQHLKARVFGMKENGKPEPNPPHRAGNEEGEIP